MKTTWVEVTVISAILLCSASFALRIIYGRQWREWEDGLIESWGINTTAYFFFKVAMLVGVAVYFLIRESRKKNKQELPYYELPKL